MSSRDTRPISWVRAARKSFEKFPKGARIEILEALTGIQTPKQNLDLIRERLKRLRKELLQ